MRKRRVTTRELLDAINREHENREAADRRMRVQVGERIEVVKHDVSLYTHHVEECERRLGRLEAAVGLIDERVDRLETLIS